MALRFGRKKQTDWGFGTVIEGAVTEELINFLLTLPKPDDKDIYNKMTPFFSIFLDNGFSSEHYGTELNQQENVPPACPDCGVRGTLLEVIGVIDGTPLMKVLQ